VVTLSNATNDFIFFVDSTSLNFFVACVDLLSFFFAINDNMLHLLSLNLQIYEVMINCGTDVIADR